MAATPTRDLRLQEPEVPIRLFALSWQTMVDTSSDPPVADQSMEDITLPHDRPSLEVTNISAFSYSETDFGP